MTHDLTNSASQKASIRPTRQSKVSCHDDNDSSQHSFRIVLGKKLIKARISLTFSFNSTTVALRAANPKILNERLFIGWP